MSMILPKLWSDNNNASRNATLFHLKKYNDLIKWKKEESILEIGFADGRSSSLTLGPLLPIDYKEFVASDSSAEMVEYARKHCTIPRSTFIQMDISASIPANFHNRFDHIFGFFVMHMVKNPRKALKNLRSMLKPGGTIFLNFFERIPVDDVFDRLSRHPKWKNFGQEKMISSYFYNKNPREEYINDIEASFKDYIFEVEKGSHIYSSEEQFNNLFISVNATLPNIPKDHYEEYIKDYLEELKRGHSVNITCSKDGKKNMGINFTCFVVVATK